MRRVAIHLGGHFPWGMRELGPFQEHRMGLVFFCGKFCPRVGTSCFFIINIYFKKLSKLIFTSSLTFLYMVQTPDIPNSQSFSGLN